VGLLLKVPIEKDQPLAGLLLKAPMEKDQPLAGLLLKALIREVRLEIGMPV
jgi:hypothetical protein